MLKNILKLEGVQQLNRQVQKQIHGGIDKCCIRVPGGGSPPPPNCCNGECCN